MLDDISSFDGFDGLGTLLMLGGWGVVGYLAYVMGYQTGLDNAATCMKQAPTCVITLKNGAHVIASAPVVVIKKGDTSAPATTHH